MVFQTPIRLPAIMSWASFAFTIFLSPVFASPLKCVNPLSTNSHMKEGINFTTYACSEWVARESNEVTPVSNVTHLDERQFATGCVNPPPKCQVNSLCNSDFCSGYKYDAPLASDCGVISSYLQKISPPSFLLESNRMLSLTYQSCVVAIANRGGSEIEYVYFRLSNVLTAVYVNCCTVGGYGGGYCLSYSGLYSVETVKVGNLF